MPHVHSKDLEFILKDRAGEVLDSDTLSFAAAEELIEGAMLGLIQPEIEARRQIMQIWFTIKNGASVRIENPVTGITMNFQLPRRKKHNGR